MTTLLAPSPKFDTAFFSGAGASALVPIPFPVAVDGHPYQVMWDHDAIGVWGARFKRDSLPLLRSQADQSNIPGEQSISPENFWRRSQENFISGAGQAMQDRGTSLGTRFSTSKGINCWTPYQLSLLNSVTSKRSSANSGLHLAIRGNTACLIDGTAVLTSTDLASWTTMTGGPATSATSICSDGTTVYTAHGTNGVYSAAANVLSSYNTGQADLVAYVKGRLMVASNTGTIAIYNPTTSGVLPTALMTKTAGFTWVGFAGGQSQIYAAGYSGTKSLIYRIALVAEGTNLGAPVIAGELPDGEIVRSITAYLGYVLIGSDLGIRFCSVASDGSLTIGALIPTASPVYSMEGYDKFVWYGLTNFDGVSTGLGRLNLQTFTDTLTPAYASDLMATGQGTVRSVHTFNGMKLFTVDGLGVFAENLNTPVSSGSLTTGWIGYDISDPKIAVYVDLKHEPLNGTIAVNLAADNGASTLLGTSSVVGSAAPPTPFQANQTPGLQFQLVFTLTPTGNVSPKLTRWTLRSYPTPARSSQFQVPIILFPKVLADDGNEYACDIVTERKHLEGLHASQQIVSYQQGNDSYQVVMFDYRFLPEKVTPSGDLQGVFLAYLNEITG